MIVNRLNSGYFALCLLAVNGLKSLVKEVFMNRNIAVLGITFIMWGTLMNLWVPFFPLYLLELGSPVEIVGLLTMLQVSASLFLNFIGGWLADRFGRKKVLVYGCLFELIYLFLFLLANTWEQVIPAIIAMAVTQIYAPAMNILVLESLPSQKRGAALGLFYAIIGVPSVFAFFFGGVIVESIGIVQGMRIIWIVCIIAGIAKTLFRQFFMYETLKKDDAIKSEKSVEEPTHVSFARYITPFVLVASLTALAVSVATPYLVVFAVNEIGLTKVEWGFITMVYGLLVTILTMPFGILSDRIGRKACLLITRVVWSLTLLFIIFANSFNQVLLIQSIQGISAGLSGERPRSPGSGATWQAFLANSFPSSKRGKAFGIIGTISGLIGLIGSYLGGYLWEGFGPKLPFTFQFIIGIVTAATFLLFLREPKTKYR